MAKKSVYKSQECVWENINEREFDRMVNDCLRNYIRVYL